MVRYWIESENLKNRFQKFRAIDNDVDVAILFEIGLIDKKIY